MDEPLTLENCRELRELKLRSLEITGPDLISTITSTHVQKVTFCRLGSSPERAFAPMGHDYWAQLDSSLFKLVDRPEHELRLYLEFQFSCTREWTGKPLFGELLPKTHEKARVRVVDTGNNTVVYCSDGGK